MQTSTWGELKSRFGWSTDRIAVTRDDLIVAGALVLFRSLPLRLGTLAYIPKGPLLDFADENTTAELLSGLDRLLKRHRSILLKIEPDRLDDPVFTQQLAALGFRPSPQTVQPPRTITIDLARSDDEILAAMHPKTRYNIRLGPKKDVVVREAQPIDLLAFNALMQTTGARDGFFVHAPEYYEAAYQLFVPTGQAKLLVATYQEQSHRRASLCSRRAIERGTSTAHQVRQNANACPTMRCNGRAFSGRNRWAARNMICGAYPTKRKPRWKRSTSIATMTCGASIASNAASVVNSFVSRVRSIGCMTRCFTKPTSCISSRGAERNRDQLIGDQEIDLRPDP